MWSPTYVGSLCVICRECGRRLCVTLNGLEPAILELLALLATHVDENHDSASRRIDVN